MDINSLKFLLKLYECSNHRSYLSSNTWKWLKGKDTICEQLAARGLVDFTREIALVKITPAGQALLSSPTADLSISELESKILQKISKTLEVSPSKLFFKYKKQYIGLEKIIPILNLFSNQGLISTTTKRKRQKYEVWLTEKGLDCIKQVNDYFLVWENGITGTFRKSATKKSKTKAKPTDEIILQNIIQLDRELNTRNYLPIFHLRKMLQPSLSGEELEQALYRLQEKDKIELSTLAEVKAYSLEEINTGIPQPVGGPLFFIIVN